MAAEMSPGGVNYNAFNMVQDQPTLIARGGAQAQARFQSGSDSFKRQLEKQYGSSAPAGALQAAGDASDAATGVAHENYSAKMAEATVRARLHSSYMDLMWKQFRMNQKADRWGKIGAALGSAGMIGSGLFGGPMQHPEAGGGADALNMSTTENEHLSYMNT